MWNMFRLKKVSPKYSLKRYFSANGYFVSTPIFYVNGAPHIGHMQSCMYADAFARVNRLLGENVIFSTGTDEHGLKVQKVSEALGRQTTEFCDEMSLRFEEVIKYSNVSYTHFNRTTSQYHKECVQNFWKKIQNEGLIRKGSYEGWYSVTDEAFVPSSQVKEIKEGTTIKTISTETGSIVEKMSEDNYVFALSNFKSDILQWLSKDVIKPTMYADDVRRWLDEGISDLSVSRPKSRLSWGIPVPNDDSQIIYVWLDALVNYLTIQDNELQSTVWPVDCHVIGKDILKFHAIYWPAFLMAAGYEPPKKIFCHSHWTVNYEKMSKSKGNVIDPVELIDKYSCDGFRYFLLRASVPHSDSNYSEVKIHRMLNSELADNLGNLLSRSCAASVNLKQVFPKFYKEAMVDLSEYNVQNIIDNASDLPGLVQQHFLDGYFYKGIDCILACLRDTNAFMQFSKPWILAKLSDDRSQQTLSTILHIVLEVLRISGLLLQPVVPTLSDRLLTKLQVPNESRSWREIKCFLSYHDLPNKLENQPLARDSTPLFERRRDK